MNNDHAPLAPGERIQALDIIRGFALLGILLMNIEYFQRPMQAVMLGFDAGQSGLDHWVALFSYVFVQGKFYTMFSFLFGIGFVVFLDRALARGAPARVLFVRRLLVLAAFGAAHAFLVWTGDILLIYGLAGLLLLFFARTPAGRLWKWGIAFYLFPTALMWLFAGMLHLGLQSPQGPEIAAQMASNHDALLASIAQGEQVYRSATWAEAVEWRASEYLALYGGGVLFFIPGVLGLFLFGAAFARAGVFHAPDAHQRVFVRMTLIGYALGIPAALYVGSVATDGVVFTHPTPAGATMMTMASVASLALCFAYVGTLMLLLRRIGAARALVKLAPAGRMALTNYLTQSIVFTLLFYGYGLGLYGEYGRAATTVMALALYAFQVWFSGWWLERYRIGPMEWLWRTLTYGRVQAFRSPAHSAA